MPLSYKFQVAGFVSKEIGTTRRRLETNHLRTGLNYLKWGLDPTFGNLVAQASRLRESNRRAEFISPLGQMSNGGYQMANRR
jgi:hypothetical protein